MTDEPVEPPRRYPSTIGGALYLLMLAVTVVGIALIAWLDWRVGVRVVAGSLLGIALLRALMPAHEAGMLAVRSRVVDVAILTVVGAVLIFLAGDIPDQPILPLAP